MSANRFEIKVGIFVVICLVLLGTLIISFSKGLSIMQSTYIIKLRTSDVGGIKPGAGVLMAGVRIGTVSAIELADGGRSVVLSLKVGNEFGVHRDAAFNIEQAGLLGDQYVAIIPTQNAAPVLKDGDEVGTAPAADFKRIMTSAGSLLERLEKVSETLQTAIGRVDTLLLSETNLLAVSEALTNLRSVSRKADTMMDGVQTAVSGVNDIVQKNAGPISETLTNLAQFSIELKSMGKELNGIVATNRDEIARAISNLEKATGTASDLLTDVKNGKGLVGGVLTDERIKLEVAEMVRNLAIASSNLANYGILYKPKPPRKPSTNEVTPVYTGRKPTE